MIADFYDTFKDELKINKTAATCIYAGMVTDSGRFRYREVDGETMRLAGLMLDQGVDTDVLYANLYLKDFSLLKFEAYVQNKIKVTKNGVAYIFVSKAMKKKFNLSNEDASAAVSYLDAIRGSLIWIAFIENDDAIRVRFRSRFVTVSELAEKYRGGGHACAAGGTVYSKREMKKAIAEADELLKNYKENNKGWL
jgi:phosphoesterase RecJ-like protein